MVMEGGCFVLQLDVQTGKRPDHGTFLSSPSSNTQDRQLPARCRTDKTAPTPTLLQAYSDLGAPYSHGKAVYPFSPGSQGLGHTGAPGSSPSIQVTVGETLVVTHITVGLVTWLGQDRYLLSIRETWDGQP